MDGREILNVVVTENGVKCSIDGSLIDVADATAQVVKSVYNAIQDGGMGHEGLFRLLLMMVLADPDSGVLDTIPNKDIKKKCGHIVNASLLAESLKEEMERRKPDATDKD